MEEGVAEVAKGTDEAARSGVALQGILHQIGAVTTQIHQIATAAEEQTATTSEISSNICNITEAFSKTAQTAQETSKEAGRLNKLSEELQETIKRFKTKESDILMLSVAAHDHRAYVTKVKAAVYGFSTIQEKELPNHEGCRFGKWFHTQGKELCGHQSTYQTIAASHQRIHSLSLETVAAVNSGDSGKAIQLMNQLEGTSDTMIEKLKDMRQEYLNRT
jgi:methyl-accepting chemotaxis protein